MSQAEAETTPEPEGGVCATLIQVTPDANPIRTALNARGGTDEVEGAGGLTSAENTEEGHASGMRTSETQTRDEEDRVVAELIRNDWVGDRMCPFLDAWDQNKIRARVIFVTEPTLTR